MFTISPIVKWGSRNIFKDIDRCKYSRDEAGYTHTFTCSTIWLQYESNMTITEERALCVITKMLTVMSISTTFINIYKYMYIILYRWKKDILYKLKIAMNVNHKHNNR